MGGVEGRLYAFCPRCMRDARYDYDRTPNPSCGFCHGTGYVKASWEERRAYWRLAAQQEPAKC